MEENLSKELKALQLDLLKNFIDICKNHNLQYFLVGGTALGAVRHQGFIPWDDDIDVGMPRHDYETFLKIAQTELPKHVFLQTNNTDPKYPQNFAKLRNSDTTFIEKTVHHLFMNHGVYIDVFPLDGFPSNTLKKRAWKLKNYIYKQCIRPVFYLEKPQKTGLRERFLHRSIRFIWRDPYKTLKKQNKLFSMYSYNACDIVANHCGAWLDKEIMPKSYFGNGTKAIFETLEVCIPKEYDKYLTHVYGDYMTLPPEEKRVGHHYCTVLDPYKPYTEYINK